MATKKELRKALERAHEELQFEFKVSRKLSEDLQDAEATIGSLHRDLESHRRVQEALIDENHRLRHGSVLQLYHDIPLTKPLTGA